MKNIFITVLFIALSSGRATSQSFLDWKAYTSFRTVNSIVKDDNGRVWSASEGGIVVYEGNQVLKKLTPIDGLSRLDGSAMFYSSEFEVVFVGYLNGDIDVIETDNFNIRNLDDIARNVSFPQKGINDFIIIDQSLFVATNFGLVEFDLEQLFVKDSYLKFGQFSTGTPVYDIVLNNGVLYIGTSEGIAFSTLNGNYGNADWNNIDSSDGYVSASTFALSVDGDDIYASTMNQNYIYENNTWAINSDFQDDIIIDYEIIEGKLIAVSEENIFYEDINGSMETVSINKVVGVTIFKSLFNGDYLIGTKNGGIVKLEPTSGDIEYLVSEGPYSNFFEGMNFYNGVLISGSTRNSSRREEIDRGRGFYIFKDEIWKNYNEIITPEFSNEIFRQAFTTTASNEYYYFGSWGSGVARLSKETGAIKLFDDTNSTLKGWPQDSELFPVISGMGTDSNDDVWAVSRYGGTPLYRQTPGDEDWQAFNENAAISNSDLYESLFVDSYDQKWISLENAQTSGTGLLVIDTKAPKEEGDDVGVKLAIGTNNGNLPDNNINVIIEDKNGEVWIGTERGIAKFTFPELIVTGSEQERDAQWLINDDTTSTSRFLLRDINATAMTVNAANQKWVGSANQGIWLLNAEGSRIIKRFTKENSPLFSNSIKSIAINDESGEVFIATDVGLISYMDIPKRAKSKMKELKVFPNPFTYSKNEQVIIEGLSEETVIKVLGVDGTVVHSFEAKGGRASWDGKGQNRERLGSGVYFIVAIDTQGSTKGMGKVVIVK